MSDLTEQVNVRRGSLLNVETHVFFVAACAGCNDRPDEDGQEFTGTPEEAVQAAVALCWGLDAEGLLRCPECLRPDDTDA